MASTHPGQLTPALDHLIQSTPTAQAHLLLRVTAISPQAEAAILGAGFQIQRRLTLLPVYAVSGPASGVLDLLGQPWLLQAELDRPVHTHG